MKLNYLLFAVILFLIAERNSAQLQLDLGQAGGENNLDLPPPDEQKSDPEIDRVISIVNKVEENNNFIDRLSPDSNAKLPFGIIKQLGAARYTIAIDSMRFLPQGAFFSAYAAIDFPGTLKKLAFRGSHIKFNPSGVIGGNQARLYLASNHIIRINSTVSLHLQGNNQNWVEWDCGGFKAINLVGQFVFKKNKIIPDESQTPDTVVTAAFRIYTEDIHNFITQIDMTPFKINGLDDWSFKVTNATVDMSTLSNVANMTFPVGYNNPNNLTSQMWTGFYLQSLKIKLPQELSKTAHRTEININNLLIDNMGLTGLFKVNNLFSTNEGSMSGWDFSIDELGAGFTCNQLTSGQLKGLINIPITDSSQALEYNANINYNPQSKNVDYGFVLKPASGLRFNVFSAVVNLNNNSSISVTKTNGYFKPTAILSGQIAFDNNKFNSNGGKLSFQNLTIINEAPYITNGVFTLHNINGGQTKCDYYPVTVDEITFGINQSTPVLGFKVIFNLTELLNTPLTVSTSILLKGKIESRQKTYVGETRNDNVTFAKTRWGFDRVVIDGVGVDIETTPVTLKGNILFKDNDPVYGAGIFGMLDLSLKKILEDPIGVNVGFGSKEDYRYFFIDAKVPTKYIIPSTPIGLSRIIGGIYYHMSPNKSSEAELIALNQNFNNINGNALTYYPNRRAAFGLKIGATGDFILNESVCNGDFLLDVHFTNNGGLGPVSLIGNVYSMATIANKASAPIKGRMTMVFDHQNKVFDALAQVNVSYHQIVSGSGYLKVHFDPQTWNVCAGTPSSPNNINILSLGTAPFYFMTGKNLEQPVDVPQQFAANRSQAQFHNGSGFCAGGKILSSLNRGFAYNGFNVSCAFNFTLAFDLLMTNYGENATCGSPPEKVGVNGRVAQGNMYLVMNGNININGNFRFPPNCPTTYQNHSLCGEGHCCCASVDLPCLVNSDFNYNIFSASFEANVSARVPKPYYFASSITAPYNYFGGRLSGQVPFNFTYGNNCEPVSN